MIEGVSPVLQAALGTAFTWAVTALGAALVFVLPTSRHRVVLDVSLGFAGGVMLSASFWSLLAPARDLASTVDDNDAPAAFVPLTVGVCVGAAFVAVADLLLDKLGAHSPLHVLLKTRENVDQLPCYSIVTHNAASETNLAHSSSDLSIDNGRIRMRRARGACDGGRSSAMTSQYDDSDDVRDGDRQRWRRMFMLVMAVTIHNIPEGMAVGVSFAAVGSVPAATFSKARSLAVAIAVQNFPEGLAVSVPLRAAGLSLSTSFWYGQLSGMVEPVAGMVGAGMVAFIRPLLPYALSFAAGAMIYVVIDDILPDIHSRASHSSSKTASLSVMTGFVVMMILDLALE